MPIFMMVPTCWAISLGVMMCTSIFVEPCPHMYVPCHSSSSLAGASKILGGGGGKGGGARPACAVACTGVAFDGIKDVLGVGKCPTGAESAQ